MNTGLPLHLNSWGLPVLSENTSDPTESRIISVSGEIARSRTSSWLTSSSSMV